MNFCNNPMTSAYHEFSPFDVPGSWNINLCRAVFLLTVWLRVPHTVHCCESLNARPNMRDDRA
ncbi:hypothetical protein BVI434_2160014 [Burkholderia vietnamiensis]|nr:hypothetical protein BVI434_2160014 [Burkholderia vietnamiensis]